MVQALGAWQKVEEKNFFRYPIGAWYRILIGNGSVLFTFQE